MLVCSCVCFAGRHLFNYGLNIDAQSICVQRQMLCIALQIAHPYISTYIRLHWTKAGANRAPPQIESQSSCARWVCALEIESAFKYAYLYILHISLPDKILSCIDCNEDEDRLTWPPKCCFAKMQSLMLDVFFLTICCYDTQSILKRLNETIFLFIKLNYSLFCSSE